MHQIRRNLLAAVAVTAAALVALPTAAPAAPAGDTYQAQATSSALRVNLFGQGFTIAAATTDADSSPQAHAEGQGALVSTQSFGATTATADAVGETAGSDAPTCSDLVLPQEVPLLDLSSACSTSQAAVTDAGPAAAATGKSLELKLSGDPALSAIPVDDLTDQIGDALVGGLGPLVGAFPVPPAVIVDQLNALLNAAIVGDVPVLTIEGGASESTSSADGDSVDAATTSHGAVIKLLDREALGGAPILTIEVGNSTTSVSRDRASGNTTAEQTAIPVKVTVAPDVAFLLQLPQNSFEVPEGQQVDLPLPTPLTSSIKLSGGSTSDIPNGKKAESGSLELNLLQGVNGGIQVGISTGSSAVAGTEAPKVQDTVVTTVPPVAPAPTTLPRTGVEERSLQQVALLLALGAAITGLVTWTAVRRSRLARG